MRILHLINSFGSGGAERQLSVLAPMFNRIGVETAIGHISFGVHYGAVRASGVQLFRLRAVGNFNPALISQSARLIQAFSPDLVQTWLPQMDVIGGVSAIYRQVPFIISERSSEDAYKPGLRRTVRECVGRYARAIVANSSGGVRYWRSCTRAKRVFLIPNCIVPAESGNTGSVPEGEDKVIIFAGRLSEEKNVIRLAKALILVLKRHQRARVEMYGEGPLQGVLAETIGESPLMNRFTLCTFTSELVEKMRRASVCVSVSLFEGHPNVVLEAAQVGCPLVLSDISAHRDILPGGARFVDATSIHSIADGVLNVLADREGARARAKIASGLVEGLSVESVARSYQRLYRSLACAS